MYIREFSIKNVRSFTGFCWKLNKDDPHAGWHVLLGDNGAGKSTILKSCALALLGARGPVALHLDWRDWVRQGQDIGSISLELEQDETWDNWSGKGRPAANSHLFLNLKIDQSGFNSSLSSMREKHAQRTIWGDGEGWFSASYGPFRRFSGGNPDRERMFYSMPKVARHLSIFGEDVALTETLSWLKDLHYEQLDARSRGLPEEQCGFLPLVKDFINQSGLLPNCTVLVDVNPKGVVFNDSAGHKILIESLSEGYRSVLSMTLELVRQLALVYSPEKLFSSDRSTIIAPGVVFIDEVDVHLHPRWQRSIGSWMTKHFPNIQFIVTTHSPLVCQGAMPGTVTRLPQPGVEDDKGERIAGVALDRLLYGDILEAISSGAFGSGIERSEEGQQKLQRLALLNRKARRQGLDDHETEERQRLQAIFGSDPD